MQKTHQMTNFQSGSLQEGVAAPYDFKIFDIFREAWSRTYGFKWPVIVATLLIFIALTVVSFGIILILELFNQTHPALVSILTDAFTFVLSIICYPLFAGILMMGLYRSVDADINYKMAFSFFSYSFPIIIATFCTTILIMLGLVLLVIPGIYLTVAYVFTLPLIIEKNMDFWQAMETSRKAVHQHWFKVFFTYTLMLIIYVISAIPFGIGLIWSIPLFVALHGILYRIIFGITAIPN